MIKKKPKKTSQNNKSGHNLWKVNNNQAVKDQQISCNLFPELHLIFDYLNTTRNRRIYFSAHLLIHFYNFEAKVFLEK